MSIRAMIDSATTPREFHHAAVLVSRSIRENEEPEMNAPLIGLLLLKCVAMTASGAHKPQDVRAMANDAMTAFHTNPPGVTS